MGFVVDLNEVWHHLQSPRWRVATTLRQAAERPLASGWSALLGIRDDLEEVWDHVFGAEFAQCPDGVVTRLVLRITFDESLSLQDDRVVRDTLACKQSQVTES